MNNKGEVILGLVLVGVVIGIFATFVGHLNEKGNRGVSPNPHVEVERTVDK